MEKLVGMSEEGLKVATAGEEFVKGVVFRQGDVELEGVALVPHSRWVWEVGVFHRLLEFISRYSA